MRIIPTHEKDRHCGRYLSLSLIHICVHGAGSGTQGLRENLALVDPHFHADAAEGGSSLREAVLNVGADGLQEMCIRDRYGEVPNQFAADAYDCVYAYKQALEAAGATPDMDAATLCDLMIQQFTSMTFDGLTGTGMTWDTNGRVSKDPKGMVIKDGAYAGLD